MSLTYGGTTYRSLEEQVRKNMEDISTEAGSLSALTDKVDNLKTGGEKVSLTFPEGASSGTVTDEQLAKLQENDANYIEMVNDKELYYLNDPGHEEGYLTYSHVGIENSKATIKTLTITISAKSFVIVTTVVPTDAGGGKLYRHFIGYNDNTYSSFGLTIYLTQKNTSFSLEEFIAFTKEKNISYHLSTFSIGESGKITGTYYLPKTLSASFNSEGLVATGSKPGVALQDGGNVSFNVILSGTSNPHLTDVVTEL